ncbi:hypothetical protein GDO78_019136 [Eleutherodactylus coqui]|uniref:Uncharacterized protein n=1 Tax=Eleutherodactylus coqui TaxID=57060 RepID=A0A8J6C6R9_ELECQ|nr:hypothetical protein GDO78_019136 [Eleutherodactylus coqui]
MNSRQKCLRKAPTYNGCSLYSSKNRRRRRNRQIYSPTSQRMSISIYSGKPIALVFESILSSSISSTLTQSCRSITISFSFIFIGKFAHFIYLIKLYADFPNIVTNSKKRLPTLPTFLRRSTRSTHRQPPPRFLQITSYQSHLFGKLLYVLQHLLQPNSVP